MNKRIIAIILLLLVVVFAFAGCSKYKTYVDDKGNTHVLVTDEEGNSITNADGDIVVAATNDKGKVVTDENGETETRSVDNPGVFTDRTKNTLETKNYVLKLPSTWEIRSDGMERIQVAGGSTARIDIVSLDLTYDETLVQIEELLQKFVDARKDDLTMNQEDITFKNTAITKSKKYMVSGATKNEEGEPIEVYIISYAVEANGKVYHFSATAESKADYEAADFESIIELVQFR